MRYPFHIEWTSPETLSLTMNEQKIDVKIREDPGGVIIATIGGKMHRIVGKDEALGLR